MYVKLALRLALWMPGVAGVDVGRPGDDPRVRRARDDAELAHDAEALLGLHVAGGEVAAAVGRADGVDAPAAVQLGDVAGDPCARRPRRRCRRSPFASAVLPSITVPWSRTDESVTSMPAPPFPLAVLSRTTVLDGELADLDAGAERAAGVVRLDRRAGRLADRDAARVAAEVVALDERVGGELDRDARPGRRRDGVVERPCCRRRATSTPPWPPRIVLRWTRLSLEASRSSPATIPKPPLSLIMFSLMVLFPPPIMKMPAPPLIPIWLPSIRLSLANSRKMPPSPWFAASVFSRITAWRVPV